MTVDDILNQMKEWVETKAEVAPSRWTELASSLNLLKDREYEILFTLQQQVAHQKSSLLLNGETSSSAKIQIEATDLFKQMKLQEAKLKTVDEQIKIAKAHGKLLSEELRGS